MDGKTHKYITKMAIEEIGNKEIEGNKEGIIFYCEQPDIDEKEGAYKNHFYNPSTRKNFRGERESALTKFIKHYRYAIDDKKNGRKYYEHIGRCLHYLVDLNTPVHTYYEDMYDAAVRLKQHIGYEEYCNELIEEAEIESEIEDYGYYIYNSIKDIGKWSAREASILFQIYDSTKVVVKKDKEIIEEVAKKSISNGIKSSKGILYRFIKEIEEYE